VSNLRCIYTVRSRTPWPSYSVSFAASLSLFCIDTSRISRHFSCHSKALPQRSRTGHASFTRRSTKLPKDHRKKSTSPKQSFYQIYLSHGRKFLSKWTQTMTALQLRLRLGSTSSSFSYAQTILWESSKFIWFMLTYSRVCNRNEKESRKWAKAKIPCFAGLWLPEIPAEEYRTVIDFLNWVSSHNRERCWGLVLMQVTIDLGLGWQ